LTGDAGGPGEAAADTGFYSSDEPGTGAGADIRHLPRGLAVMLLEPHPLRRAHNTQVWLAKAEMLLWYPIVGLAVVGLASLWRARRQSASALAFPVLMGAGSLFVTSLAEGNFGTAFRHRGEFVWVMALLAAVGLRDLWQRRRGIDNPVGVTSLVNDSGRRECQKDGAERTYHGLARPTVRLESPKRNTTARKAGYPGVT